MANVQPATALSGLVVPDIRTRGVPITATTQAGARAGAVIPSTATSLALKASGTLDASISADIDIQTRDGGMPGPRGASYLARETGTSDWWSHDPPTAVSRFDFVDYTTTPGTWTRPHGVRLASGLAAAVAVENGSDVVAWRESILSTWARTTIHAGSVATAPCFVSLPNGQLACLYTVAAGSTGTQIRMDYSADSGLTWTNGASAALDYAIGYTPSQVKRIRCAIAGDQASLFVWIQDGAADILYQYAGDSVCSGFVGVEVASTPASASDKACPDVVAHAGGFLVATIEKDATLSSSIYVPKVRRLGGAYQSFSTTPAVLACDTTDATEWGAYAGGYFHEAECALLVDDDGALYVYGRDHDAAGTRAITAAVSWDAGATWGDTYQSPGHTSGLAILDAGDATFYAQEIAVIPERGRAILLHTWQTSTAVADDSLCCAFLGGFTTVPMSDDIAHPAGENVAGWGHVLPPVALPQTLASWTKGSAGAPTEGLSAYGLVTTSAGGANIYYYSAPTMADPTGGIQVSLQLKVTSGTARIYVRASDGANDYFLEILVSTTTIEVKDVNAASLATVTPAAGVNTGGVELMIAVGKASGVYATNTGSCRVWYRKAALLGEDGVRLWTLAASSSTLVAGALATNLVQFGNVLGASSITWKLPRISAGVYTAGNVYAGAGTRGRYYSTADMPGHVWRGLRLWAVDGPGRRGDEYACATVYDYGATNLDPWSCPSPLRGWRSTDVAQNHDITRTVDLGWLAGELAALYLAGANARIYQWRQDSGGGSVVADIDLALATTLKWSRTKDCISPVAGGSAFPGHLTENALAGCWWVPSVGGTPHRIRGNSEGGWLTSAVTGYRPVRIYLEDYTAGGATSGSAGMIWSDRALVVTDLLTSTDELTLRIPYLSNAGVASYFSLSTLLFGRMVIFGHPYGPRSLEDMSGVASTQGQYGAVHSRRMMAGPQAVEMPWADGMDTSRMFGTTPPDYMTLGYASAPPIAIVQAGMSGLMRSVVRDVGKTVPVLYVPSLPQQSTAPTTAAPIIVAGPERSLLGWIETETLRTDVVLGEAFKHPTGELVRGGTVRLRSVT